MNRYLATAGKGLAGAGLTGVVLYLVSTATDHQRPFWPYWILFAMVAAGLLLYLLGERTRPGAGWRRGRPGRGPTCQGGRSSRTAGTSGGPADHRPLALHQ
jgi:hypothetical protein